MNMNKYNTANHSGQRVRSRERRRRKKERMDEWWKQRAGWRRPPPPPLSPLYGSSAGTEDVWGWDVELPVVPEDQEEPTAHLIHLESQTNERLSGGISTSHAPFNLRDATLYKLTLLLVCWWWKIDLTHQLSLAPLCADGSRRLMEQLVSMGNDRMEGFLKKKKTVKMTRRKVMLWKGRKERTGGK